VDSTGLWFDFGQRNEYFLGHSAYAKLLIFDIQIPQRVNLYSRQLFAFEALVAILKSMFRLVYMKKIIKKWVFYVGLPNRLAVSVSFRSVFFSSADSLQYSLSLLYIVEWFDESVWTFFRIRCTSESSTFNFFALCSNFVNCLK